MIRMSTRNHRLFHLSAYYIEWSVCLYSAAHRHAWIGILVTLIILPIQVLWQYRVAKDTRDLLRFMVIMTVCGSLIDTAMMWSTIVIYHDNYFYPYLCPPWMILQWTELALIAHALLSHLWQRPFVTGLLCLLGFPLAYISGAQLGAAELVFGWKSAALLGLIWMLLFPVLLWNHQREVSKC